MKDLFHDSAPTMAAVRYSPGAAIGPVSGRLRRRPQAPHRADKRFNEEALRAAGNAIVPQVAYEIIRGIVEIERGEHFPDVRKEADKV